MKIESANIQNNFFIDAKIKKLKNVINYKKRPSTDSLCCNI